MPPRKRSSKAKKTAAAAAAEVTTSTEAKKTEAAAAAEVGAEVTTEPAVQRGKRSKAAGKDEGATPEPAVQRGKRSKTAGKDEGATPEPTVKKTKEEAVEAKIKLRKEAKTKLRKEASLTYGMDFSHECKTADGRKPDLKIASWNINGIRAWMDKGGLSYIKDESPDMLCVQKTKCALEDIPDDTKVDGYHCYWSSAKQAGYAGTGLYSKTKPVDVTFGLGIAKHDDEGRVITAEYDKFFLVNAYVPNSDIRLSRLAYRTEEWDVAFREHLNKLNKDKPVIMCGDLSVAHHEIDLKNPKTNKKTAGFTEQERQGFTDLLAEGYIDSFRELYPEQKSAYSFWKYKGNARAHNDGWRLDYFVLSERLKKDLCDNVIRKDVKGSDHCPIVLYMALDD